MKGKVDIMAIEGIGATGSSSQAYTDMMRQNVNREIKVSQPQPQPQAQPKAKEIEEYSKKVGSTANMQAEDKGMAAEAEKENATSKMKDAIDKVNKKIEPTKTRCEFSYHEETKRISIKVIDQKTEETIREIPPEETLDMLSKIWELAGLMVDERR